MQYIPVLDTKSRNHSSYSTLDYTRLQGTSYLRHIYILRFHVASTGPLPITTTPHLCSAEAVNLEPWYHTKSSIFTSATPAQIFQLTHVYIHVCVVSTGMYIYVRMLYLHAASQCIYVTYNSLDGNVRTVGVQISIHYGRYISAQGGTRKHVKQQTPSRRP